MTIRDPSAADIPALGAIAETSGLFPADLMADMIAPGLAGEDDTWLVAEEDGAIAGFAFARPEELADRVWNILAIAVDPDARGASHASNLLHAMEAKLDARMIIIETTQRPEQDAARAFYAKEGYEQVAHVTDFYADGEDKIIYRKVMA